MSEMAELVQQNVSVQINKSLCIICQKRKGLKAEKLSIVGDEGKDTLLSCAKDRFEAQDVKNAHAICRIQVLDTTDYHKKYQYHRTCYSMFTNKSKIERLKKQSSKVCVANLTSETEAGPSSSHYVTRSKVAKLNKALCVFCQENTQERIRLAMSENIDATIKDLANYDYKLHIRLSCMSDVVAHDILYHSSCIIKSGRDKARIDRTAGDMKTHFPLLQICKEVRMAASFGQTLQLSAVWERYLKLANFQNIEVPKSFSSRRSTFKDKLKDIVGDVYQFFQPLNRDIDERQTLLIPIAEANRQAANAMLDGEDQDALQAYEPEDNDFRTIVHSALRIRGELKSCAGHDSLEVSKEAMSKCVPDVLHLFLSVLLHGEERIGDFREDSCIDETEGNNDVENGSSSPAGIPSDRLLSIAQDILFASSNGKKITPKHVALALTLHQASRSKKLVNLFYAAGHCMSYNQVLQADTALAEVSLKNMDEDSGAVVPPNFIQDDNQPSSSSALHVTADNIDIMTDTPDGKKTFHSTQMVAFMRGRFNPLQTLKCVKIGSRKVLSVPLALSDLAANTIHFKPEPKFDLPVDPQWYKSCDPKEMESLPLPIQKSRLSDIAFAISRLQSETMEGWTKHNMQTSENALLQSAVGYMPLILNPAHEISTLYTVANRCVAVANKLGKKHVILTTDQALYAPLLEIVWSNDVFRERIILRMGGLHISMNFQKIIGKHMSGSGLADLWLESGLMGEGSISKVFEGKAYKKAMRAHKITFQALWRRLLPTLQTFLENEDGDAAEDFLNASFDCVSLKMLLEEPRFLQLLSTFLKQRSEEDENFALWWSYIDMVLTLLLFTKAIRSGNWEMYRHALTEMLPYIAWYDHTNYFRSLTAYIASLNQLPKEVEELFKEGDFGVLRTNQKFAQVDPDHAQEWIVGLSKSAGGIVGITQEPRTLQRWALSFYWRTEITRLTYELYGVQLNANFGAETRSKRTRNLADEESLLHVMESFHLLDDDPTFWLGLCNVATKDKATEKITKSLLNAKAKGAEQVQNFVASRLIPDENLGKPALSFYSPLTKNKGLTLADLHSEKMEHHNTIRDTRTAEKNFLHTLVVAYDAGRKIDLRSILKHELCKIPPSLAIGSGELRLGEKASLSKEIMKNIQCPNKLVLSSTNSVLLIDGMALIVALGKPAQAENFGDLSRCFNKRVLHLSAGFGKVHILLDRYRELSVKSSTRKKRTKKFAPVRRQITHPGVPLPKDWKSFLSMPENKTDLARFLSERVFDFDFGPLQVFVSGGFENELEVRCTDSSLDLSKFSANHEEADTRIVLHAVHSTCQEIVVMARDTDVILLLIHHYQKIPCSKVWVMAGTARDRKYIPIHELHSNLSPDNVKNILSFHAVTGCDSTSKLASVSKVTAWRAFQDKATCQLLDGLGKLPLSDETKSQVEEFIVSLYKIKSNVSTCDEARNVLFGAVRKPEALPPTSDAAQLHILRCHYQVCVWEQAHLALPEIPSVEECGWSVQDNQLLPTLRTLEPIPKSCPEIITCGCKTNCATRTCACKKAGMDCMKLCKCQACCLNAQEID